MQPKISRAYAAGYFDAEGCVRVVKPKNSQAWQLRVSFGQTDATIIKMLAKQYGGGLYGYQSKKENEKAATYWVIGKQRDARKFLRDIWPHLREKYEEVEVSLGEPLEAGSAMRLAVLKKRPIEREEIPEEILSKPRVKQRCSIEGCGARHCARGLCSAHYQAAVKTRQFQPTPKGEGRPYKRKRCPTMNERRYIAGFFDGDGCVSFVVKHKRWIVHFGQCRPEAVLMMQGIYGGVTQLKAAHGRRRPKLTWTLNQRLAVQAFLDDVRPYVIEKRRPVCCVLSELLKVDL